MTTTRRQAEALVASTQGLESDEPMRYKGTRYPIRVPYDPRERRYDEAFNEAHDLVEDHYYTFASWDVDDYHEERKERGIPDLQGAGLLEWCDPAEDKGDEEEDAEGEW